MKYTIFIFTFLATSLSLSAQQALILDKIIARVGSENILYSEVQELFSYAKSQSTDYTDDIQCDIMDQLIGKALLLDQAKLDSIVINEIEVEVELQRRIDFILGQMQGNEELFHNTYGKTPIEQKEVMREPLREDLIQQRIQGQLIQDVTITPKEVVAYFESIPSDSLPYLNAEVELGEIISKTMISDKNKEAAQAKLQKIRDRIINDGEDFAELASIFSDDPGSAQRGGDLGWQKRGTFVPEFEAAAYNLSDQEISDIVETPFGYHMLQLLGRRGNSINLRHILIKPEVTQEDIDRTKNHLDSIAQLISTDSLSFEIAVRRHSDDESQSYNNAGRLNNDKTGDTFWETADLPYQIYFAIEELEPGDVSEVLEFEQRGDKIYKIIQLQSKTKPHKASLETDYSKIQNFAKKSKKNEYFNNWIEQKIDDTLITIVDDFRSCPNLMRYYEEDNNVLNR